MKEVSYMNLADKLKYCRNKQQLTQEQIARLLHVSRKTISGWENSRSFPDIGSLVKISELYQISLDDLLKDNRLLKEYTAQNGKIVHNNKIAHFFYYLTFCSWLLGYVECFNYKAPHFPIILLLLIFSIIAYLSHFSNWSYFKSKLYLVQALISFVIIFFINVIINLFILMSSNYFENADRYALLGFFSGRLFLIFWISVSLEIVLFFRPTTKITNKA